MTRVTTRVLAAHVALDLAEKLDQLAARPDRSRGWIIRQALAAWIDQQERSNGSLPETADGINHGPYIDHRNI